MNSPGFDFGDFVALAVFAVLLLVAIRVVRLLGRMSARIVAVFVRMGLISVSRALLQLVGYDRHTYLKPRTMYLNRVEVRFMLFWGGLILWAFVWHFLKTGRTIQSVGPYWVLGLCAYIGFRCLSTMGSDEEELSSEESQDEATSSSRFNTNQSSTNAHYQRFRNQIVQFRAWDYLDDLFQGQ
ncbi:hypothetical protein [Larkinella sp. C7]|uniref:hypothetical protein n=1 Tax=Larkinella sp. C7 TaxID=2576607 RepID=UPI0011115B9D|nr:hypothetical protein [Larkinella sp. C7]